MTATFQQRMLLHNSMAELEALKAEGRGMLWENEQRMLAGESPLHGESQFNELAARIRATKVEIDDAVTMERLRG